MPTDNPAAAAEPKLDLLARIDDITTDPVARCWQCQRSLAESASDDFCGPTCQTAWHSTHAEPLTNYHEAGHNFDSDAVRYHGTEPQGDGGDTLTDTADRLLTPAWTFFRPARPIGTFDGVTVVAEAENFAAMQVLVRLHDEDYTQTFTVPRELLNDFAALRSWAVTTFQRCRETVGEHQRANANPVVELAGGPRHGTRLSVQLPPRAYIEFAEFQGSPFVSDVVTRARYRRKFVNGDHWVYVYEEPAGSATRATNPISPAFGILQLLGPQTPTEPEGVDDECE